MSTFTSALTVSPRPRHGWITWLVVVGLLLGLTPGLAPPPAATVPPIVLPLGESTELPAPAVTWPLATTSSTASATAASATTGSAASLAGQVSSLLGSLPIAFEPAGPGRDSAVHVEARALGGRAFFTADEVVLTLPRPASPAGDARAAGNQAPTASKAPAALAAREYSVLRLRFAGANPTPEVVAVDRLPGVVNDYRGNDPAHWQTAAAAYAGVLYRGLYPGIDLRYDGRGQSLKSTYTVAPGADPAAIRWRYDGATAVRIDGAGNLLITLPAGSAATEPVLTEHAPVAWQEIGGERVPVPVRFTLDQENLARFALGDYDRTEPLVIDPVLLYSTYLGGDTSESGYGIAVSQSGNIYVTGSTNSSNFPTKNASQTTCNRGTVGLPGFSDPNACTTDVFVTKLNSSGGMEFSTYLGGTSRVYGSSQLESGADEVAGIGVDPQGNAYIAGSTTSSNFPTKNAFQASCAGSSPTSGCGDAFVAKLNSSGGLEYGTYLGGASAWDAASGIAVDSAGTAHVVGLTYSTDFPTSGAYQSKCVAYEHGVGCTGDAFVTKLSSSGSLQSSTYLGGSAVDTARGVALDSAGNAYVVGDTNSADFPGRSSACTSCEDVFVVKLGSGGSPLYSRFLGGSDTDFGRGIAADAAGNAYVTGGTNSADFPTLNAFQPSKGTPATDFCYKGGDSTPGDCEDAFVVKLNSDGAVAYSTFLGGNKGDRGYGIAVDPAGNAYVAGSTTSLNFPSKNPIEGNCCTGQMEAFIARVTPAGGLDYSSFLSGSYNDSAYAIAVDSSGNAYVTGSTESWNFPTRDAFQPTCITSAGYNVPCPPPSEAFVSKISGGLALSVSTALTTVEATSLVTITGYITNGLPTATSAITFTLDEGEGAVHAPGKRGIPGTRVMGSDGITRTVHFPAGEFAAGEGKSFSLQLLIAPTPGDDPTASIAVTTRYTVTSAAGDSASATLTITATDLLTVPVAPLPWAQLQELPVADIADPFGAMPDVDAIAGTAHRTSRPVGVRAVNPSDFGDAWDYYLHTTVNNWEQKDKDLYYLLKEAGFTKQQAYAAVYVRALSQLKPDWKVTWNPLKWAGIKEANRKCGAAYKDVKKKTAREEAFLNCFKVLAKTFMDANPTYYSKILEFHEGYTTPLVEAGRDYARNRASRESDLHREIGDYVTAGTPLSLTPFPRLVEADVDFRLRNGRYLKLHEKVLRQVTVYDNLSGGGSGGISVAEVIEDIVNNGPTGTSLQDWHNGVAQRRAAIGVRIHSPLLPVVTDSQGRQAGIDAETGQLFEQIPGAVIEPGHPFELLLPASSGQYQVRYTTAYPYEFGVDVQGIYSGTVTGQQSFAGTATTGFTANQAITVTVNGTALDVKAGTLPGATAVAAYRGYLPITFVQYGGGW